MRKFALMIIGISMLFLFLGGVAEKVLDKFKFEKQTISFVRQVHIENSAEENIPPLNTLRVRTDDAQDFTIQIPQPGLVTDEQLPPAEKQVFEFERQPNFQIPDEPQSFPRHFEKKVLIIKKVNAKKPE